MAQHFRFLVQMVMTVLIMGMGGPQSICTAEPLPAQKTCCCMKSTICACHPDQPCQQSCTLRQVLSMDEQVPLRTVAAVISHADAFLFALNSTQVNSPAVLPTAHRWEIGESPPSRGGPPQARLCTWLI